MPCDVDQPSRFALFRRAKRDASPTSAIVSFLLLPFFHPSNPPIPPILRLQEINVVRQSFPGSRALSGGLTLWIASARRHKELVCTSRTGAFK